MTKILLADDSMFQRKLMRDTILGMDFTCIEAENGLEALQLFNAEQPHCIVLDLLMPEMDGFTLLEELKKLETDTPKIVLSADIQETTIQKCMDLGAFAFLNKPFNKEKFIETINKALAKEN